MTFKRVGKTSCDNLQTVNYPEIPQSNWRWPCVTVRQVRGMRLNCTLENLYVFVCAEEYRDRGMNALLGRSRLHLWVLMQSTKSRPSVCSTPSLFLLMNCPETWQQEAHNSFTVTFRCHFIEIILILIYWNYLQHCRNVILRCPLSSDTPSPPYLVRDYSEISLLIFRLLCYSSLYTICEKWQCHIRPLLFPPDGPANMQPKNLLDTHFEDKITGRLF